MLTRLVFALIMAQIVIVAINGQIECDEKDKTYCKKFQKPGNKTQSKMAEHLKKIMTKLPKIYYGDNDKPVINKLSSIKKFEKSGNKTEWKVAELLKNVLTKLPKIYYGDNDAPVINKLSSIKSYLQRFGYVDYVKRLFRQSVKQRFVAHRHRRKQEFKYRITFGQLLRDDIKSMADTIKTALKMFQRFMRLDVSGIADLATLVKMNKPRCGGKDMGEQRVNPTYMTIKQKIKNYIGSTANKTLKGFRSVKQRTQGKNETKRSKRHTLAGLLNNNQRLESSPAIPCISVWCHHKNKGEVNINLIVSSFRRKRHIIDEEIDKAFKYWSDVTPLVFTKLPSKTHSRDVIIDIRFERGEHGDGDPLDGAGKVLAHSYFPQYGGDAHFDDDEKWTVGSKEGSNILITAIHELGHSLGLDHSDATDSIMNPVYPPYKQDLKLAQDDIRGIQILYGSKDGAPQVPNICVNTTIDALYQANNSIFVFKDKYFWKVRSDEMSIESEYPKPISEHFPTIDDKIDSVIEMSDKSLIVFKEEDCYKYVHGQLANGFPVKIKAKFPSLPASLDSAINIEGIVYAFKDGQYWTYNMNSKDQNAVEVPKAIRTKWPGIPDAIDAVMSTNNGIYFFSGQVFYRLNKFNNQYIKTDTQPPYPRKIGLWWFGCK